MNAPLPRTIHFSDSPRTRPLGIGGTDIGAENIRATGFALTTDPDEGIVAERTASDGAAEGIF